MTASSTIELRPLAGDDLDQVHRLEVASSPDPWSRDLLAGELDDTRSDRRWLVALDRLAEARPTVVGFGGVLRIVDEAHIMNLVVADSHRRRGLASRLLASLLLEVGDRGAISATLEVRAGNRAAVELYRRFGFEVAGRRPRYYPDGTDAEIMWRHRIDRPEARAGFRELGGLDG